MTTSSNQNSGIYYAYVDVILNITDNRLSEVVETLSVDQIKGGGINANKASISAFNKASEQIIEKLTTSGFFN
jgi:hypothetical protein